MILTAKKPTSLSVPICVAVMPLLTKYAVENLPHGTADAVVITIRIFAADAMVVFTPPEAAQDPSRKIPPQTKRRAERSSGDATVYKEWW